MDELTLWTWTAPSSAITDRDLRLLSGAEAARMERMRHCEDRDRFAAAWSLARRRLGDLIGVPPQRLRFTRECEHCADPDHGKPRLVDDGPDFSLSHSGSQVLLAVSDGARVGADIERVGRDLDQIRRYVLHRNEPAETTGLELLRYWVRKEAVLKAAGHGVLRMTCIDSRNPPEGVSIRDIAVAEGYVAAVATTGCSEPTVVGRYR